MSCVCSSPIDAFEGGSATPEDWPAARVILGGYMYNIEDQGWEMLDPMHALHVSVTPVILTTNGNQLQVLMKNNFDGPSKGEFVRDCQDNFSAAH